MAQARVPMFIAEGPSAPRPELPFEERDAITAIVRDPKTGEYLGLRWKEVDWETFITGGIEKGQTAEEAARAEVHEETGYKHLRLVMELPGYEAKFYHGPKKVNRHAKVRSFLFELIDPDSDPVSEAETKKHECVWLNPVELESFRLPEGHRYLVRHILTLNK